VPTSIYIKKTKIGGKGLHEGHSFLGHLDSSGCDSIGSIDQHLCDPLEHQSRRRLGMKKDIRAELLAIIFVVYVLIALLSAELNQDRTSSPLVSNKERIPELVLRGLFQR